jgi:hypothetical protein
MQQQRAARPPPPARPPPRRPPFAPACPEEALETRCRVDRAFCSNRRPASRWRESGAGIDAACSDRPASGAEVRSAACCPAEDRCDWPGRDGSQSLPDGARLRAPSTPGPPLLAAPRSPCFSLQRYHPMCEQDSLLGWTCARTADPPRHPLREAVRCDMQDHVHSPSGNAHAAATRTHGGAEHSAPGGGHGQRGHRDSDRGGWLGRRRCTRH